jgi:hypothetical protein
MNSVYGEPSSPYNNQSPSPYYADVPSPYYAPPSSTYPIDVLFPRIEKHNQFYAIPVLGYLVKQIMLIPIEIFWLVMAVVMWVLQLVLWIPVLFTGKYPEFGRTFTAGFIRVHTRMTAFALGLTDSYPSFSLQDENPGDAIVQYQWQPSYNRFYAIPVLGYLIKTIMLIPQLIVLQILSWVVLLMQLVTWIPVLTTGEYPSWGYTICGGYLRYTARVHGFMYGLTDQYPPIVRLDS